MNIFDIIGPVMIGPSSSHTAGAARIGKIARHLLGEEVASCDIAFHGSFAKTWSGHGTDRAVLGGLLGYSVDDERLRDSRQLAENAGMRFSFRTVQLGDAHPNTMVLILAGQTGKTLTLQASSIGGGRIQVQSINGLEAGFTGEMPTMVVQHRDTPGAIAEVTRVLADAHVNIAFMRMFRSEAGGAAVMVLELDELPPPGVMETLDRKKNIYTTIMLDRL